MKITWNWNTGQDNLGTLQTGDSPSSCTHCTMVYQLNSVPRIPRTISILHSVGLGLVNSYSHYLSLTTADKHQQQDISFPESWGYPSQLFILGEVLENLQLAKDYNFLLRI